MAIRDIFLPLAGYPRHPSRDAIRKCVTIAQSMGAHISSLGVDVDVPASSFPFDAPGRFAHSGTAEHAQADSETNDAVNVFLSAAREVGVQFDHGLVRCSVDDMPKTMANHARLRDLSLLPVRSHDTDVEKMLLALIFSSGRPVLIFPEQQSQGLSDDLDHIAIAWNHSSQAARAVGDALPLLKKAKTVRILTAADHLSSAEATSGAALVRHLFQHGVVASFESVKIEGSSIGKVLDAYVSANKVDLLVMGAYGHSWLKEFTWGGATNTILEHPPCWVLMSH